MKKLVSISSAIVLFVGLFATVWATPGSLAVVSDDNTKFLYVGLDGSTYPVTPAIGLPSSWNMSGYNDIDWDYAMFYQHSAYLDPTSTSPFDATGAKWIGSGSGPDSNISSGQRGVYLYRKTFNVPATAYGLSGFAGIAADNYGWLYLNGSQLLEPSDKTQNDRNFCPAGACSVGGTGAGPSTGMVDTSLLACENVLAAEVQNGVSIGGNGPVGVVFSLKLDYELPDVAWQPPVTNDAFELKDGTTLPLKFKLYMQDGTLITDMKDVFMMVHEGPGIGAPVEGATWWLGDGVDNLRFDPYEFYYIANFQTKNFSLSDGATYTAVVHDGCTNEVLGTIEFVISVSKGTGRGNR